MNSHAKIRTIPTFESIESMQLMSNNECVITMGNAGLLKMWRIETGRLVYAQDQSQSLKTTTTTSSTASETSVDLEPCIVQSIHVAAINSLVLTTVDDSIVFVRVDPDELKTAATKTSLSSEEGEKLFHTYKQFIGNHGEILDLKFVDANEHLIAVATNSTDIKIYDVNNWDCKILKGYGTYLLNFFFLFFKLQKTRKFLFIVI